MARITLKPEDLTVLVDTRENTPFDLSVFGFKCERATLKTGDYSLKGLEHQVVIERKSLPDLLGCICQQRERFERELTRLKEFDSRVVIVSASEKVIERGKWKYSKVTPKQVIGSYTGWMAWNIPFIFADNHEKAAKRAAHFLWINAKRHFSLDDSGALVLKEKR